MNIPQTTYANAFTEALNGKVDQCSDEDMISRVAENAVPVGAFCLMGTNAPGTTGVSPGGCKIIPDGTVVGSLSQLAGVAALDLNVDPGDYTGFANTDSGSGQFATGKTVRCLRKGRIWMYAEGAVTAGNPVYVRVTASGTHVTGQVKDGAASNFVLHPTAVFMSTTAAAGIALVEVK